MRKTYGICLHLSLCLSTTTMLAQQSLYAPLGVEASDSEYSTKIMVRWEPVAYADTYRIFRSSTDNIATATELTSTNRPYIFDTSATANQTYYYWVGAENAFTVGPISSVDIGTRYDGETNFDDEAPLDPPPEPAGNALTAAKFYLGKTLFWEEQMSTTGTLACATCHAPSHGGTDQRSELNLERARHHGPDGQFNTEDDVIGSPGVPRNTAGGLYQWSDVYGYAEQVTGRYPRPSINAGYTEELFWDGRAGEVLVDPLTGELVLNSNAALETQALGPPTNDVEMAHIGANWQDIIDRLQSADPLALAGDIPIALETWLDNRDYPALFEEAFGDSEITAARVAMAIASYERVLFSDRTPYDRMLMGIESFSASEQRGHNIITSNRCNNCHNGPNFTDGEFHNIGVRPTTNAEDLGRYEVTGNNNDRGDFLTPGLRNVALRGPYMHTGSIETLEEVLEFYDRGGDFANNDNELRPANLTLLNFNDLRNFMDTLTDERVANALPPFDHPTLYTESNKTPIIVGNGTVGFNDSVPEIVAIEPPIVGNPSFTVGVTDARPGAQAIFVLDVLEPALDAIPNASSVACRFEITLAANTEDGPGSGSVSVAIPEDDLLVGQKLYGRWYVIDQGAENNIACSDSIEITLFGKGGIEGVSGFNAWAKHLLDELPFEEAGALNNPDGDTLVNLEEYFAMTDASSRNESHVQTGVINIGGVDYPTLTFTRRQFSADIKPVVEYSDDLQTWLSGSDQLEEVNVVQNGDGTETITIRSLESITENARQFLRLNLKLVEE